MLSLGCTQVTKLLSGPLPVHDPGHKLRCSSREYGRACYYLPIVTSSILIVEDSADLRGLYALAFRRKPYQVRLAGSGAEALEILRAEGDVAVLVLDLSLPDLSGEEVLRQVRSHSHLNHLKILLVSGRDDLRQRAAELGAHGCIRKPAVLPELELRLEEYLDL